MAKLVKIAQTQEVPAGGAIAVEVEDKRIALFNVGGTFYAIDDLCPHSGGPLSEGQVAGTIVSCPWHGADFDLATGAVKCPPAEEGVRSYKVVVEGNDLKIEL